MLNIDHNLSAFFKIVPFLLYHHLLPLAGALLRPSVAYFWLRVFMLMASKFCSLLVWGITHSAS